MHGEARAKESDPWAGDPCAQMRKSDLGVEMESGPDHPPGTIIRTSVCVPGPASAAPPSLTEAQAQQRKCYQRVCQVVGVWWKWALLGKYLLARQRVVHRPPKLQWTTLVKKAMKADVTAERDRREAGVTADVAGN